MNMLKRNVKTRLKKTLEKCEKTHKILSQMGSDIKRGNYNNKFFFELPMLYFILIILLKYF
jgi:hypothetical protein